MAEDHVGQRKDGCCGPWTRLFVAFKVALDPKKLLLAGAGIFVMWLGWWVLAMVFYSIRSKPEWSEPKENAEQAWKDFKDARRSWDLLHEMAGPRPLPKDAADIAESLEEYREIRKLEDIHNRLTEKVKIEIKDEYRLIIGEKKYSFTRPPSEEKDKDKDKEKEKEWLAGLAKAETREATLQDVLLLDAVSKTARVGGVDIVLATSEKFDELKKHKDSARELEQARQEYLAKNPEKRKVAEQATKSFHLLQSGQVPYKRAAALRAWPGCEDRGPNPYLLVTRQLPPGEKQVSPISWLLNEQVPILLEPLFKFLRPIVYFFRSEAGTYIRLYLILVILWTVGVWGYFGGAITRMAAAQVARNEKVGFMEALRFAKSRCMSYFSAPLLPLIFLAVISLFLWAFGLVEAWTFIVGDFLALVLWPLILGMGLVMAVVLVGLVGWPLMNATISCEGSDNFDALSRSYSYVYQAPWHYLGYGVVALAYGAVLVFFVGLMGSLMVYFAKWGVTNAPTLAQREPSYLFIYAPTSFGWRDLLLHNSPNVVVTEETQYTGDRTKVYSLKDNYRKEINFHNRFAAGFVTLWLYLLFFMIVGFGYSFFWTASTIIYLLLRLKVDDTELEEINLGEEDFEEPFPSAPPPPAPAPPASAPPGPPPGFTMVEPPSLKPSPPPAGPEGSPPPGAEPPKPA